MRKKITIVGGGVCALMLGCELDHEKFEVLVYEKNPAMARKFLVAGDGGLNLTHNEDSPAFIKRYTPSSFLEPAFMHFSNHALINWFNANGIPTFVGSSSRVFPEKGIKPIDVLTVLLNKLKSNGVSMHLKHEWLGFSPTNTLLFKHGDQMLDVTSDYVIFCLGGASWPVTGSTGNWKDFLLEKGIRVNTFLASNCSFKVNWPESFLVKAEGKILKNIALTCTDKTHAGEVVITRFGLEGSGIYPLSPEIRQQLALHKKAEVYVDLKPMVSVEKLIEKLNSKAVITNRTAHIKTQLNLTDVQLQLLKCYVSKEDFLDPEKLCAHIKNLHLEITGTGPVEDAISTVGGIDLDEIDSQFELKKLPGYFAIGEMLDYDAPTGGYLLQSCFSMGKFLADHLNK